MHAMRRGLATGRTEYDLRGFIVRLIGLAARTDVGVARFPRRLKLGAVACRIVAAQKCIVLANPRGDEVFRNVAEYRFPFAGISVEQPLAAPTGKARSEFPTQIGGVFEPIVEAVATVRRMGRRAAARHLFP